eukprot:CAMPEP_0206421772 /NCGR_PEP_ID=MMETSP0324_2-20121206/1654_1 /ASSEMBLY_ACC=CAM_ASM_000836 /TAXON_ID=2866 /ORGANISM="Crypthecodinium cohnii, Strain Seligo" /LENGTH=148 /DNA_ID=CAMNT_0053885945 /DNA_START=866 /DNA_END=1309 /DNA_ORIENTATION=-
MYRQRAGLTHDKKLLCFCHYSDGATIKHRIFSTSNCSMHDALPILEDVAWCDTLPIDSDTTCLYRGLVIVWRIGNEFFRKDLQQSSPYPPLLHMCGEVEVIGLDMTQTTLNRVADAVQACHKTWPFMAVFLGGCLTIASSFSFRHQLG